jgi:4'-phosphopantetheinyl transferase
MTSKAVCGVNQILILRAERDLTGGEYSALLACTGPEKQERIRHCRSYRAAQNTLLGDILVRREIGNRTGTPQEKLVFYTNQYGKPFYDDAIYFNISHSGNVIAVVLDSVSVGIDIETMAPATGKDRIMERFFTPEERSYCTASADESCKRFYEIWTKKEAYIKKEGKGLSIPLQSFNVFSFSAEDIFFHKIDTDGITGHVCAAHRVIPEYRLLHICDVLRQL